MPRTKQQQAAIDIIKTEPLVKIKAIAGSGKTYTLTELAKELNPTKGLYLAYNKAIATEAQEKFKDTNIECTTIHAMAYQTVVKGSKIKVGKFGIRNVVEFGNPITYKAKKVLVDSLEDFLLSEFLDPVEYLNNTFASIDKDSFMEHLDLFANGGLQCNHSFYLKLFHIYLANGDIELPQLDLLLLDECGDVTALTLDIFKRLNSTTKVAVGDPFQNIYSFNKTINAFTELKEGVEVNLTESFRVSTEIAQRIEGFVTKNLDKTFEFKGHIYPETYTPTSKAYISRYNSGLLEEMFRLYEEEISFNTTRKIESILELPLVLANLGNGQPVKGYQFKHLETVRQDWLRSKELQTRYPTVTNYAAYRFKKDEEISQALRVVYTHGPKQLNDLTKFVKASNQVDNGLTLTTAHSSKGLEWDSVEIAPDLNEATTKALVGIAKAKLSKDRKTANLLEEELRLYYVGCSRARVELLNAKLLPRLFS